MATKKQGSMSMEAKAIANKVKQDKKFRPDEYLMKSKNIHNDIIPQPACFTMRVAYQLRNQAELILTLEREIDNLNYRLFNEGQDSKCDNTCDEISRGFEADTLNNLEHNEDRLRNLTNTLEGINERLFGA